MTTYREITYYVLDALKLVSDDSHFVEEHILFLADKYRTFVLKQRYSDIKREIPESNYQTICLDLKRVSAIDGSPCTGKDYLRSTKEVPSLTQIGKRKISSVDFFQGNFAYTNNERFKYVGSNEFLKNQIYGTIAPDNHLYLKSNNPQMYYLNKVKLTGIFEDGRKAAELQCSDEGGHCNAMEAEFPLEEALIPMVIELIVKELAGMKYQAEDNINNANDDLANIAAFIRRAIEEGRRANVYKNLQ